ncbi:hypothetical protein KEM55_003385 [Ascosphaera atra]|nr:hypothetical protein KEM55_003385 [Ascosphaera atra]
MTQSKGFNEFRLHQVYALYSVPIALGIITTGARVGIKSWPSRKKDKMMLEDWLIALATLFQVLICILFIATAKPTGVGRHVYTLDSATITYYLKVMLVTQHLFNTALALCKIAILSLLHRVFPTPGFRLAVKITAVAVGLWWVAMEILAFTQCIPYRKLWDYEVRGKCLANIALTYAENVTNVALNCWIFLMPLPVIFGLHLGKLKKAGFAFIFSVGLATCIISGLRLSTNAKKKKDPTYDAPFDNIIAMYETVGELICANVPFLYKLALSAYRKIRTRNSSEDGYVTGSGGTHGYGQRAPLRRGTEMRDLESGSAMTQSGNGRKTGKNDWTLEEIMKDDAPSTDSECGNGGLAEPETIHQT